MGISGLLPFLKDALVNVDVRQFQGQTVAVDTYCWIYRGAFGCAEDLAVGRPADGHIKYVVRYVNKLLEWGIKPIMIFDGSCLPSKKGTEQKRKESKETYRKKASQLLKEGRANEAKECFQRCIECTPKMALEVIQALHSIGVDVLVAPYEADAQLAYLNKANIAQLIITEDSDLILFGCERILYKMDLNGSAQLIEKQKIISVTQFDSADNFERFRWMCILSGCDYLENLPGIGLGKAKKLLKSNQKTEIDKILKQMPKVLKMTNLVVTNEYVENFKKADNTFKYQIVFDPLRRKLVSLHPYPPDMDPNEDLSYAGTFYDDQTALQHSLGNLDVNSHEVVYNFNPDNWKYKPPLKYLTNPPSHMRSIWSQSYTTMKNSNPFTNAFALKPSSSSQISLSYPITNKDLVKTLPVNSSFSGRGSVSEHFRSNVLVKRKFDSLNLNSQKSSNSDKENEAKKTKLNLDDINQLVAQYNGGEPTKSSYFCSKTDPIDTPNSPLVIKTSQSFMGSELKEEKTLAMKSPEKEVGVSNGCVSPIVNEKSKTSLISMFAREKNTFTFGDDNTASNGKEETPKTLIILDDLDQLDSIAQKAATAKVRSSPVVIRKSSGSSGETSSKKPTSTKSSLNNKLAGVQNTKITSFMQCYTFKASNKFSLNQELN